MWLKADWALRYFVYPSIKEFIQHYDTQFLTLW